MNLRVVALLAVLAAPAAATNYSVPYLPASVVLFVPDASSSFCASDELRSRINPYFAVVADSDHLSYPDLRLDCEPHDDGRVQFTLRNSKGDVVDRFRAKILADRSTYDTTAFLVARRLATGSKTIKAALTAYLANSRYQYAGGGIKAFDAGDWTSAADMLYRGLESDAPPTASYFGLYAAHARLGHAARARWYLMEYCESEGKRLSKLDATQLSYLKEIRPPAPGELPAPGDLSRYRSFVADRNWVGAIFELKDLISRAPWTVEAYDALADAYKAVGWDLFEANWRQRAKLARRTAADKRVHEELLDAIQTP